MNIKKVSIFVTLFALVLSWGISNAINSDISSATSNFSVSGIVTEVSNTYILINNAKGSVVSSDGTYSLNLEYLKTIETNTYQPLTLSDIKTGDKIVAQGLTNGSIFFIKRIISFASLTLPPQEENATTTDSTATTTEPTATAPTASTTESVSTSTPPADNVIPPPAQEEKATTTPPTESTSTPSTEQASTTEQVATSSEETATTTPSIIENITNAVEDAVDNVIDAVTETVQNVVETITGSSTPEVPPTPETPPTPEAPPTPTE
jgi:hypothetical protein